MLVGIAGSNLVGGHECLSVVSVVGWASQLSQFDVSK